jgi:hypothetical protein
MLKAVAPTDAHGTESLQAPSAADVPSRFMRALQSRLSKAEAGSWLAGVVLRAVGEEWELVAPSPFKADWIRAHFSQALEHARACAGLDRVPLVVSGQGS